MSELQPRVLRRVHRHRVADPQPNLVANEEPHQEPHTSARERREHAAAGSCTHAAAADCALPEGYEDVPEGDDEDEGVGDDSIAPPPPPPPPPPPTPPPPAVHPLSGTAALPPFLRRRVLSMLEPGDVKDPSMPSKLAAAASCSAWDQRAGTSSTASLAAGSLSAPPRKLSRSTPASFGVRRRLHTK